MGGSITINPNDLFCRISSNSLKIFFRKNLCLQFPYFYLDSKLFETNPRLL
ncbi:hypothetical protein LEP1GSC124_1065 [Leptospira interrogans serovar Pyrogenes str. 200701872]|uniref:Uncharacterized protein n=1 Tax=Leptospira interrogans serovar Pyrogenes str. 200701872 TaxID=1193029 RepID=M7AD91_LEPIR|nr:hypothetical protein LEP1GSC124_1065 [Leptospira interrogans serovar Pyrogenes str. 200701872]